ncbi:hypothetical protein AK812_SmicGene44837 [Symbiodinium microadriaticum]|uniref:Uncharacterized protein n=1 Tax=Symbiodinium microadriaticum TaxID=2951 RepID=A0A1Q9BXH4_SYMMI|nr:hypothetical protein AK812_SmicGene44837 [Symbiodinium microadriaticum]
MKLAAAFALATGALAQSCTDLVPGWEDNDGQNCSTYVNQQICTPTGGYGPGMINPAIVSLVSAPNALAGRLRSVWSRPGPVKEEPQESEEAAAHIPCPGVQEHRIRPPTSAGGRRLSLSTSMAQSDPIRLPASPQPWAAPTLCPVPEQVLLGTSTGCLGNRLLPPAHGAFGA